MATEFELPLLPVPRTAPPSTRLGRWLLTDGQVAAPHRQAVHSWRQVLWLTGVDYFSTLGYQPAIALLAAGALAPAATLLLVLVTLFGAVPVYAQVARRSYAGQGSIAMLESLLGGWTGKLFVLVLLGFAATDFVITMTLSAADAARHAVENPILEPFLGDHGLAITLGLLVLLAVVFLKGFREAILVSIAVAVPYILLNLVVLLRGAWEILQRPELVSAWRASPDLRVDWPTLLIASAILFPKLALGLSGFETGVAVMPHIAGEEADEQSEVPKGRIRATRKLLLAAALIMSAMLLLSSLVTTLLVPREACGPGGPAEGRAIALLAHQMLGRAFGTVYDMWTIAILWFAGASAMAGLLNLIPRYLPRFGMAPRWIEFRRPLVLLLFGVDVIVTLAFQADVEAQAGAYATGVLALILSAAFAVALVAWREARAAEGFDLRGFAKSGYFWVVAAVFAFALVDNVVARPDGVVIAAIFILAILVLGGISRYVRSTELRASKIQFADRRSADLWRGLVGKKVNLVPLRGTTPSARQRKAAELRRFYAVEGPLAFLHIHLIDNRSEFLTPLRVQVNRSGDDYVIVVSGAIAIANSIAYLSELLHPISLFLGLTGQNLMTQAMRYLLLGEGETGLMVYKILLRYWEWTKDVEERPRIFLVSDSS